jgi:hypothetical protein
MPKRERESDLTHISEPIPKVLADIAEKQKAAEKAKQNKDKQKK